ncbi:MAG: hypothetical protein RL272_1272 [Candidatus Parcubacteria bacterium]|jgi:hypothetical protein
MGRLAFALGLLLVAAGCGGADDGHGAGGSDTAGAPTDGTSLPPRDDPGRDDGSGWPRWKNPCPGPACDPYRDDPRWLIDPPPDEAFRQRAMRPSLPAPERASSPASR